MNDTWYVVPAPLALRGVGKTEGVGREAPRMLLVHPLSARDDARRGGAKKG
jgi:hypothetical protein